MMKKLYHVGYTTPYTVGFQKIKVLAGCEIEAFEKVKNFIGEIQAIKVTKVEKVLY